MAILNLKKLKRAVDAQLTRAVRFEPGKNRWPGDDDQILCTFGGGNVADVTEDGSPEAKVYLPADCGQTFSDQGIGLNEMFRIQYRKTAAGAEFYEIRKLGDAAEPAQQRAPVLPTDINATPIERQLTTSINQANQRKAEQALSAPARQQSTTVARNAQTQSDSNNAPIAHTVTSRNMAGALCASIDATQEAERYAHSKGIEIEFGAEDIRAIAATIFIQLSKDPGFVSAQKTNGGAQPWHQ